MSGTRLLKWVGDPPVFREDGETVANWRYENARTVTIPGKTERIVTNFDRIKTGPGSREFKDVPNGLSKSYYWHASLPDFVLEVDADDARIILQRQPYEFIDVTMVKMEDIPGIRNVPILKDATGKTLPPLPKAIQYKEIAKVTPETLVPVDATSVKGYGGQPYEYKPVDVPLGKGFDYRTISVAQSDNNDYSGT